MRERNTMCKRNSNQLPLTPPTRTRPTSQACALTGNPTSNLSTCRRALNPRSHISQGSDPTFFKKRLKIHIFTVLPIFKGDVIYVCSHGCAASLQNSSCKTKALHLLNTPVLPPPAPGNPILLSPRTGNSKYLV